MPNGYMNKVSQNNTGKNDKLYPQQYLHVKNYCTNS